ncbi:MAG: ParB/RepB/Spo0J family partition protein [Gammaproteobacteria bacterium]|nr:ParB/RepB/Spo0J family partition protein [Gammaproteobacteria bacterium]
MNFVCQHPDHAPNAPAYDVKRVLLARQTDDGRVFDGDPVECCAHCRQEHHGFWKYVDRKQRSDQRPKSQRPSAHGQTYLPGIVHRIAVDDLSPDPTQPRTVFHEDDLRALGQAMKADGQETPITFRHATDADDADTPLIIKHGERRWHAAVREGITHLDGLLDTHADADPVARLFQQISNNTHAPLAPLDIANAARRLHDDHDWTDQAIADAFTARGLKGLSRPVISNLRRLFGLPEWAIKLIETDRLTPSHGKYLLQVKHPGVLDALRTAFDDPAYQPTIESLQVRIRNEHDRQLMEMTIGNTPFLATDCADCTAHHTAGIPGQDTQHFCAAWTCHAEKTLALLTAEREAREAEQEAGESEAVTITKQQNQGPTELHDLEDNEPDPMLERAVAFIRAEAGVRGVISNSALQRELRIGYNLAARLMEKLEEAGHVGPLNRNGSRNLIKPATACPTATTIANATAQPAEQVTNDVAPTPVSATQPENRAPATAEGRTQRLSVTQQLQEAIGAKVHTTATETELLGFVIWFNADFLSDPPASISAAISEVRAPAMSRARLRELADAMARHLEQKELTALAAALGVDTHHTEAA